MQWELKEERWKSNWRKKEVWLEINGSHLQERGTCGNQGKSQSKERTKPDKTRWTVGASSESWWIAGRRTIGRAMETILEFKINRMATKRNLMDEGSNPIEGVEEAKLKAVDAGRAKVETDWKTVNQSEKRWKPRWKKVETSISQAAVVLKRMNLIERLEDFWQNSAKTWMHWQKPMEGRWKSIGR